MGKDDFVRMELHYQATLLDKDKELHDKEKQIQHLDQEVTMFKLEIEKLEFNNKGMLNVVTEYEKTISEVIADRERERVCEIAKEKHRQEKDQILDDLHSAERAFNDVHRKYERTKEIIGEFKRNEDLLKAQVKEVSEKLQKSEERYELLKTHAEGKLNEANQALDEIKRTKSAEISKLQMMLRKADMKVSTLERTVEQKTKENIELTNICDELISKVGT